MADRLGVRLLGEFRIDGVDIEALRSRQARTLLKRLALERGGTVSADSLVEAVWPSGRPAQPDRDLYVLVSRARTAVGADRVVRREGGYALVADWWDVVELASLTREAVRRSEAGDAVGARTAAEGALALVRGPTLADEPDAEWATAARSAADTSVAEVRRVAGAAALATGQVGDAAAYAAEALRADPYDETALRTLMRAHAAAGRPASALAEFARFRGLLAEELGVDPAAETRALHEELLREGPAAVARPERTAGLVGRVAELRTLDAELARSRDGARMIVVSGEPGVGKTALLDQWASVATARGAVVLRGTAEQGELALQPVLDALAGQLAAVATGDWAAGDWAAPGGLPGPGASADALSLRVFAHLDEAVRSLPIGTGTALLIDDADGADPVTWAWLAHVRRRRELPLLLVVALRDAGAARAAADLAVPLAPLGAAEVAELVGPDRAEDLRERCGGNPLLLTELARAGAYPDDEVPGSLREAVRARLRRTGAAEPTLQAAAVLGRTADLDLLAGVLQVAPLDVLEQLDVGVRQEFLAERGGELAFRHELVRLAVAAGASATRRAWLHRGAAAVLRSRPGAPPLELVRHARAGGDRGLAAHGLAHAAEVALTRLDLAGAERLLDEAVELQDGGPLRLQRSRVRMSRGNLDGADADAVVAMATDETGEALELRAWAVATGTTWTERSGSAGPRPGPPSTRPSGAAA